MLEVPTARRPGPLAGSFEVFSEATVDRAIIASADQILRDRRYRFGSLLLIAVLKGGMDYAVDLERALSDHPDAQQLTIERAVLRVERYGNATAGGKLRLIHDVRAREVRGRHVLLVEDMIDQGLTLQFLVKHIAAKRPASVAVTALFQRAGTQHDGTPMSLTTPLIYNGSEWLFGRGLDVGGRHRGLRAVYAIDPSFLLNEQ